MGYVPIFDFVTPAIEKIEEQEYLFYSPFFWDHPARIGFYLNEEKILPNLIPNSERNTSEKILSGKAFNLLEVWYPEDIPLAWVNKVLIFHYNKGDCRI